MTSKELIKTLTKIAIQYDEESKESKVLGKIINDLKDWDEICNNPEGELK